MTTYITEEDIKNLNEKKRLEYFAVHNFLKVYDKQNKAISGILELSENPDIKVDINKKIIGVEVAHAFYDEKEAQMYLTDRYESYIKEGKIVFLWHELMNGSGFINVIEKIIANKSLKNYGKNTWLLVRTVSPIFGLDTLQYYPPLKITKNNFEQIWIVFQIQQVTLSGFNNHHVLNLCK